MASMTKINQREKSVVKWQRRHGMPCVIVLLLCVRGIKRRRKKKKTQHQSESGDNGIKRKISSESKAA